MRQRPVGMTLPEILVIVAVVAVLIGITVPAVLSAKGKAAQAACHQQLMRVGQALIAYRQDTGAYPEPERPIGTLAEAYPKILSKIPTCPRDIEDHHDTYAVLYNYWGFRRSNAPKLLTQSEAATLYTDLMSSMAGKYFWRGGNTGTPDADFPGLANSNTPGNTIVTACPHHASSDQTGTYLVLRVSGEVQRVTLTKADMDFWALSESR